MDCERALKARLIDLGFGMNRAFSADGFVIITDPGVVPQAGCELAPLGLNTCNQLRILTDKQPRLSSEPETDQQNQDKRGQNEPRDHDDLDSDLTNGRNVVVDIWITIKESVTIVKNIRAA